MTIKTTPFGPARSGQYKGHTLIVQTARSAGHDYANRGGYTIRLDPPYHYQQEGQDIEGIGWVPHRGGPKTITQKFCGWYKHKATAIKRAADLAAT